MSTPRRIVDRTLSLGCDQDAFNAACSEIASAPAARRTAMVTLRAMGFDLVEPVITPPKRRNRIGEGIALVDEACGLLAETAATVHSSKAARLLDMAKRLADWSDRMSGPAPTEDDWSRAKHLGCLAEIDEVRHG